MRSGRFGGTAQTPPGAAAHGARMMCDKTCREVIPLDSHVEMAFREIPAGRFRMGSRGYWARGEPVHVVEITAPFWLGETPVTQEQFAVWTRAEGVEHQNHFERRPDHAAENMTWRQAVGFCAWLTRTRTADVEALVGGGGLACLPTEAEWEYACRAGTDTEYHAGDGEAALAEAGWYGGNAGDGTRPAGRKQANGFCLFDMHGNVWEWCHDAWDGGAYRARVDAVVDPGAAERLEGWTRGLDALEGDVRSRVLRGGSWRDGAWYCRSAFRYLLRPGVRFGLYGFRVCLVRGPAAVGHGARNGEDAARRERRGGQRRSVGGAVAARRGTGCTPVTTDTALVVNVADREPDWDTFSPGVKKIVLGSLERERERGSEALRVDALPADLAMRFPSLTHLHLWNISGLTSLPALPSGLLCLDVRRCEDLETLPKLPESLETLDLGDCKKLAKLPPSKLARLERLYINGCVAVRPAALLALLNVLQDAPLKELDASAVPAVTSLEEFPREALRKLVLSGCTRLTDGSGLETFPRLEHLNLSGCTGLAALPNLPPKLRFLVLHGAENLRLFMGQDIGPYDRGGENQNVAKALQSRRKFGRELAVMPHAKLLLMGDGRVGKTTLAKRLRWEELSAEARANRANAGIRPSVTEPPTHRVSFFRSDTSLALPGNDAGALRQRAAAAGVTLPSRPDGALDGAVRMWDFGGQEIYHSTHRIFAREGAVFLLVWSATLPDIGPAPEDLTPEEWQDWNRERSLDYWLDYIYSMRRDAQVALVCTRCPDADRQASLPNWRTRAPRHQGLELPCFHVDCLEERCGSRPQFRALAQWIREACGREAQRIGILQPRFYRTVNDMLDAWLTENSRAREADQAPEHLLFEWERWESSVTAAHERHRADGTPPLDEDDVSALTGYLHEAGHLFLLREGTRQSVLVDQEWAAELIYRLLLSTSPLRKTVKRNGGWFFGTDLGSDPSWKALDDDTQRTRLLAFMEESRVVTRIADARRQRQGRDVYLASDRWLLPPYDKVEEEVDRRMGMVRQLPGSADVERFAFEDMSISEFDFRALQAHLARTFGASAVYFRTGLQALDDDHAPEWCFRVRWLPEPTAEEEAARAEPFHGKVDAVLLARSGVLERVRREVEALFYADGSPFASRRPVAARREPTTLDLGHEYFRGLRPDDYDVAVSSSGADATDAQAMIDALKGVGYGVNWYRIPECRSDDRARVDDFMKSLRWQPCIILLLSEGYLRYDPDSNWYCYWELADAIRAIADGRRDVLRTIVVFKSGGSFDFGGFDEIVAKALRGLAVHFLGAYRDHLKAGDQEQFAYYEDFSKHFEAATSAPAWKEFARARGSLGAAVKYPAESNGARDFSEILAAVEKAVGRKARR